MADASDADGADTDNAPPGCEVAQQEPRDRCCVCGCGRNRRRRVSGGSGATAKGSVSDGNPDKGDDPFLVGCWLFVVGCCWLLLLVVGCCWLLVVVGCRCWLLVVVQLLSRLGDFCGISIALPCSLYVGCYCWLLLFCNYCQGSVMFVTQQLYIDRPWGKAASAGVIFEYSSPSCTAASYQRQRPSIVSIVLPHTYNRSVEHSGFES